MKTSLGIGIILSIVFVIMALAFGVDWTIDDQKYVCDCSDVHCDPFAWFGEHLTGMFWFILLLGFVTILFVHLIDLKFIENGSG